LLVILLWIPQLVTAEDPVEVLTPRYDEKGPYALVATADETFGQAFWFGNHERYIYFEDVTSLVQAGAHTYTVSGFDASMHYRDGAGLVVVYEDPSLPWNRVVIRDGLDRFCRDWGEGPRGETAITCFTFERFPEAREMDFTIFVGGVAVDGPDRPNALWYRTGTDADTMPTDMIFEDSDTYDPGAVQLQGPPNYPFRSFDGKEWDTYTNWIPVPAGHTWACIQIESAEYLHYRPSSGVGMAFGASFEVRLTITPTRIPGWKPTLTTTPTGTPTPTETSNGTPTLTTTPNGTPTPPTPTGTPTTTATPTGTPTTTGTPTGTPTTTATPTPTVGRLPETGGFPGWFTVVLGVPLIMGAAGLLHLALLGMRGRRGDGKGVLGQDVGAGDAKGGREGLDPPVLADGR
jgi:hypothetical protein